MFNNNDYLRFFDLFDKVLTNSSKAGVLIGSLTFFVYCFKIGYFPEGVTLGDGLLLILCGVAFVLMFSVVIVFLTCLGLLLISFFSMISAKLICLASHIIGYMNPDKAWLKIRYFNFPVIIFGIYGVFLIFAINVDWSSEEDLDSLLTNTTSNPSLWILIGISILIAFFWIRFSTLNINSTIIETSDPDADDNTKKIKLIKFKAVALAIILLCPLLFGNVSNKLLFGAMKLVGLRSESVDLHIRKPYDTYSELYCVDSHVSKFGDDFKLINDADILLKGLGSNLVAEVKVGDCYPDIKKTLIIIPKDQVVVANRLD